MGIWVCPVCGRELKKIKQAFCCEKGHSFDIASQGYVNLLLANEKHSKTPGDSPEMVHSRDAFLSKGYYACLLNKLNELVYDFAVKKNIKCPVILDAGCCEGYYTRGMDAFLRSKGLTPEICGIDICKEAVKIASRQAKEITFAVANIFKIPLRDGGADVVLNLFSPLSVNEFYRILRPGGILVIASPGKRHLYGLKELLYEKPYENEDKIEGFPGWTLIEKTFVSDTIELTDSTDIGNLFSMTPYFWKTPADSAGRLTDIKTLTTPIEFEISVFEKQPMSRSNFGGKIVEKK